jgi:hypothetical protein
MSTPGTSEVVSISRVLNTASGDAELCRSFTLTKEDVIAYFSLAEQVDSYQFDQDAMILPCKYQGTIKKASRLYHWEVFAGGAGYLYDDKTNDRFICREKCLSALPHVQGP